MRPAGGTCTGSTSQGSGTSMFSVSTLRAGRSLKLAAGRPGSPGSSPALQQQLWRLYFTKPAVMTGSDAHPSTSLEA